MRAFRALVVLGCACVAFAARVVALELTDATIAELNAELNAALSSGAITSEKLTQLYLARIAAYDQAGPKLNAILHLNAKALETARALDAERRTKGPRSALHAAQGALRRVRRRAADGAER